jgi:hypothetical protein
MNQQHLLTVEIMPDDNEVIIVGDEEGLTLLAATVQKVLKGRDHEHLFSPSWAGNELSETQQIPGSALSYKLTIYHSGD